MSTPHHPVRDPFAALPTPAMLRRRVSPPRQLLRFLAINVRMLRLLFHTHAPRPGSGR